MPYTYIITLFSYLSSLINLWAIGYIIDKGKIYAIILQVRYSINGRRLQSLPSKGGVAYGISCSISSYFNSGIRIYHRNKKEITASVQARAVKSYLTSMRA